jgi:hypothetical protein
VATGCAERFTEFYGPRESNFSVMASPVPGGLSVYFHDLGDEMAGPTYAGASVSVGKSALGRNN